MNLAEKLELARALVELGVDVIEAGFPIASPGDFEAVREIARSVRGSIICGLARCRDADIDRAGDALRHAERARMHVFLATSPIHREFKLKMSKEEVIRQAVAGVKRARGLCADVEYSPEDATRTEPDFLCQVVEATIAAGATTINIPDTVGYATPKHMGEFIETLRNRVPNIDRAVISIHCHNDLGLAVANSLAAVEAGAGQIECTVNGLGERAGNCSLEEIVMALRTRGDYYGAATNIHTQRIVRTSRLTANITGIQVQRNKAIVGENAFAHEAGIHQDGMLKERTTYEIMHPEDVGFSTSDLVMGKHSGRAALADRAKAMGYTVPGEQLDIIFEQFKILADKKKEIYDADIAALVEQQIHAIGDKWTLDSYKVICGTGQVPAVSLRLRRGDEKHAVDVVCGDGPVDAVFLAIEQVTGYSVVCRDFTVHSVTLGKDAQGEAMVQVEHEGRVYRGRGVSTDSVEASAKAFLNAINRIVAIGNGGKAAK
jgi:2-isopropylmalate synthase